LRNDFLKRDLDLSDPDMASALDELPLWSAPFGLMLLEIVPMRPEMIVLDIGCGSGFPILELAQRLGGSSCLYGIDPWERGIERLISKARVFSLKNVTAVKGTAEKLPFGDGFFDLIVSNNGLNNVQDMEAVLAECSRTLSPGGRLVFTYNLAGTMSEFYKVFQETLAECGKTHELAEIKAHIFDKRRPLSWVKKRLVLAGFRDVRVHRRSFRLRYLDGSAMLRSFFIGQGFLEPWKNIVRPADLTRVFARLEKNLNAAACEKGELSLTIPMACLDCGKRRSKMSAF